MHRQSVVVLRAVESELEVSLSSLPDGARVVGWHEDDRARPCELEDALEEGEEAKREVARLDKAHIVSSDEIGRLKDECDKLGNQLKAQDHLEALEAVISEREQAAEVKQLKHELNCHRATTARIEGFVDTIFRNTVVRKNIATTVPRLSDPNNAYGGMSYDTTDTTEETTEE